MLVKCFNDLVYERNQVDTDLYSSLKNQVSTYSFFFLLLFFSFSSSVSDELNADRSVGMSELLLSPQDQPGPLSCAHATFSHIHGLCSYAICSLMKLVDGQLTGDEMERNRTDTHWPIITF